MPKSKPTTRTTKKTKPTTSHKTATGAKPTTPRKTAARAKPEASKPSPSKENYTDEYREYLERYAIHGEGRQKLGPAEFDRCDEEMWELIDVETEMGALGDEQTIRYKELEYMLLLDNEL